MSGTNPGAASGRNSGLSSGAASAGTAVGSLVATTGSASASVLATTGSAASGDGPCRMVQPSNYDQSCAADTDCVFVREGFNACSPYCPCGASAVVNVRAQAHYSADLSQALAGATPSMCICPARPPSTLVPSCQNGMCALAPWAQDAAAAVVPDASVASDAGPATCATKSRCNDLQPQSCFNGQWFNAGNVCPNFCGGAGDVCTDIAPAPSCKPGGHGLSDCGASQESCCTSLKVPGGTYFRTYTNAGNGPTGETDPATVSGFRLDKYLVTVGRFRPFVGAWNGGWTPAAGAGKHTHLNGGNGLAATGGGFERGWMASDDINIAPTNANLACAPPFSYSTWTNAAGSRENLPINCVTWQEAYAFCIWDGGFLPSEAEWEYAAAGGSQQREYPWGSTDPGTSNQYAIYGDYYAGHSTNVAPVGTAALGAGLWGQLDLAGDVNEWTLDWFSDYVVPCTDCSNLTAANTDRVMRGGFFFDLAGFLLSSNRGGFTPAVRTHVIGFRCARSP